ncbi:MAG: hypothetical protein ABSC06_05590 [Rhodopila sp.]
MSENRPPASKGPQLKLGGKQLGMGAPKAMPARVMQLEDYARQVIGSDALWQKLIDALCEELPAKHGAYWVVLVDNPVMALAGAAAIGRSLGRPVLVPMRSSELEPTPETLTMQLRHLDQNDRLEGWVTAAYALPEVAAKASCLLVRAWGVVPSLFAGDLDDTFGADLPATEAITLVDGADPEQAALFERGAVLNLTIRQDLVVARTVLHLGLPSHQPAASVEDATDLLRRLLTANDLREDAILQALNTPEHHRFERLAWGLNKEQHPETNDLFKRTVLARGEDKPRQAAALFLVSHFDRISADQLIVIGDMLARHTPAAQPPAEDGRLPGEITDRVLEDCGIKISVTRQNGAYAFFGASQEGSARDEPLRLGKTIRDLFEHEAALLKERYLGSLARAITIGHPSNEIARAYQELELFEIRHAAALDIAMARERLVRVAFGHPALTGERAPDEHENNSIIRSMERLILRMPAFIERVATTIPAFRADDALGALCMAVPASLDDQRRTLFRRWAAAIFWGSYANGISGLTLQGYPGLFDRSPEGILRRYTLVHVLRGALDHTATEAVSQSLQTQIGGPFLGRLLTDISDQFRRIEPTDGLEFAFLTDAASNFLLYVLPRRPWVGVSMGSAAADLPLADIFLSQDTQTWTREPRHRLAGLETDPMAHETLRLYRICSAVIEALVGSASFDDLEELAVNVWLMDAMKLGQTIENIRSRYFSARLAWEEAMRDPADELSESFYQAIQPLLALLPLIVLMAATRTGQTADGAPVFTFSEPLRQWFIEPGPLPGEPPLKQLMAMLERARRFQTSWRNAHDNWHISVGAPGRIAKAFKERVEALRAFDRALKPCLEASRRRAPSIRVQGGGAASSPDTSQGPTGSETSA